jgi:hypothetical protein
MIQYEGTVYNWVDVVFDFVRRNEVVFDFMRCNKIVFRENELSISRIRM